MKPKRKIIALVASFLVAAGALHADLSNEAYRDAKAAYNKSEWKSALELLQKYCKEDEDFLGKHQDISTAINAAMRYCQDRLAPSLVIAGGVKITQKPPPPPPDLPEE